MPPSAWPVVPAFWDPRVLCGLAPPTSSAIRGEGGCLGRGSLRGSCSHGPCRGNSRGCELGGQGSRGRGRPAGTVTLRRCRACSGQARGVSSSESDGTFDTSGGAIPPPCTCLAIGTSPSLPTGFRDQRAMKSTRTVSSCFKESFLSLFV